MSVLMNRPKNMLDVYKLLPEGTPIQLINNEFYMSPALLFHLFEIVKNIFIQLNDHIITNKLGTVAFAPVDVYLGNTNAVQPDIMFIHKDRLDIIHPDGIYGAPI